MSYICTKKLNLQGHDFYPGDVVPDDVFVGDRARKLKAYGYVAETGEGVSASVCLSDEDEPTISVVFSDGDENTAYPVNTEQLQVIADIMQKGANDAAAEIEKVEDESVLAFLAHAESRKTVKEAAQKRQVSLYTTQPDFGAPESTIEATDGNPEQSTPTPEQ